jgi:hypothetical protein
VTLRTRFLALASAAALILTLAACTATTAPEGAPAPPTASAVTEGACADDAGVTLSVDASALPGGAAQEWCRAADEQIAVADLLEDAEVTLQGTEEYPDFICRVNGLPSSDEPLGSTEDPEYIETCVGTPPGFGYWALWVKPAGGEWAYAEEGVATLRAQPGESIGLLFTLDGAPAAPTS